MAVAAVPTNPPTLLKILLKVAPSCSTSPPHALNMAIMATISPITHVMGDDRSALLNSPLALLARVVTVFSDVIALPSVPTVAVTTPATIRKTPRIATIFIMVATVSWLLATQSDPFWTSPIIASSPVLTAGRNPFPNSSVTLCICCFNTWNFCAGVSLIDCAIFFVVSIPPSIEV